MDRLPAEERTEALKKWRGTGQMDQLASQYADHSAVESERMPICEPSAVFAVMSAAACAVEKGNLPVCETALDSDFSETEASGMAGPSKD